MKFAIPALGASLFAIIVLFFRSIYIQKRKNISDEIVLVGKKIDFENQSKPIDKLVYDFNKEHGPGHSDGTGDKKE